MLRSLSLASAVATLLAALALTACRPQSDRIATDDDGRGRGNAGVDGSSPTSDDDGSGGGNTGGGGNSGGNNGGNTGGGGNNGGNTGGGTPPPPPPPPPPSCTEGETSCAGNTLVYCSGGALYQSDCGSDVCALVNDDLGYRCMAPVATSILDAENPFFACAQNGVGFALSLHARAAVAVTGDMAQHPGGYDFTADGNLHLSLPGLVDTTFTDYAIAGGMIMEMASGSVTCSAYQYETSNTQQVHVNCDASRMTPGVIYEDTSFDFHTDGTVTIFSDLFLEIAGDEIWSEYHGLYRITGNDVGIAYWDDGELVSLDGFIDQDGWLNIPSFRDPVCDD